MNFTLFLLQKIKLIRHATNKLTFPISEIQKFSNVWEHIYCHFGDFVTYKLSFHEKTFHCLNYFYANYKLNNFMEIQFNQNMNHQGISQKLKVIFLNFF